MFIKKLLQWKHFVLFMLALSTLTIFFTNQFILRDFPNSGDEYSYLISAELFSNGKLSVPSPIHKEFFEFYHIINDGKFYGKYSPGWPFFLMFGKLIGFPMVINLILGISTLIIIYLTTKYIFSEKIARISILLMAISPYFIFNSSSYFPHTASLFFLSLFAYIYFNNLKSDKPLNWCLMGLVLGISFNIKQLDAAAIGACFFFHYTYVSIKNKESIKTLAKRASLFLIGFIILIGIFFLYNWLQTGNPFLMPFSKYNPKDTLGFGNGYLLSFKDSFTENVLKRSLHLNIWVPLCFIFITLAIFSKKKYKYLMLSLFLTLFVAYFFYGRTGSNQYGPRYLYASSFALFPLIALGLERLNKRTFELTSLILIILNISFFIFSSSLLHNQVNEQVELYDQVKEANIQNSIVFLDSGGRFWCSGRMSCKDLVRNDIFFNNSVLYVHNLGKKNKLLMQDFPNRNYYLWHCPNIKFSHIRFLDFWKAKNIDCKITILNTE